MKSAKAHMASNSQNESIYDCHSYVCTSIPNSCSTEYKNLSKTHWMRNV